jgi:L-glyceraldehyde 3-phosphate reductase
MDFGMNEPDTACICHNPYGNFGSKKYLIASLDQSLKRMGLEYVDIFYHHRPDPETPLEEALYVGISNYPAPCRKFQPKANLWLGLPESILLSSYSIKSIRIVPFPPA